MSSLSSRTNPRVRRWQRLARDARARRSEQRALIEGPHLLAAYLDRHGCPKAVLVSEDALRRPEVAHLVRRAAIEPVLLSDAVFRSIADAESPAGIAAEIEIREHRTGYDGSSSCVFLDGIQDAGNVGTIIRSAAAFGIGGVVLSRGCADAWSPKALRAGMGGHFAVDVHERQDLVSAVERFGGRTICAVTRGGTALHDLDLSGRVGWVFGSEGQGVSKELAARSTLRATIQIAAGAESLNVAAAAAICLYEARRQLSRGAAPSGARAES
jgi:TrmH family RNA methyltransferase